VRIRISYNLPKHRKEDLPFSKVSCKVYCMTSILGKASAGKHRVPTGGLAGYELAATGQAQQEHTPDSFDSLSQKPSFPRVVSAWRVV
jgi:hypothetical protein